MLSQSKISKIMQNVVIKSHNMVFKTVGMIKYRYLLIFLTQFDQNILLISIKNGKCMCIGIGECQIWSILRHLFHFKATVCFR